MQVIIISSNNTTHQHWHLSPMVLRIAATVTLLFVFSISYMAYQLISDKPEKQIITIVEKPAEPNKVPIVAQQSKTEKAQMQAYYAKRLGTLQAEAFRLKALTDKLAELSGLDIEAEGLDKTAGQGGVMQQSAMPLSQAEFESFFSELENSFDTQSLGLIQLQDYLITEDNIKSAIPAGRPIEKGWISSYYGYRVDPFNGKKTFHHGLDFAGKAGSDVLAVADGIVSWHGTRGGYGEMIEIDHGNGYQSRYAHNKKLVVKLGDRIKKGQAIALMGSTGRSTGPHVHFEILRDGKTVNPANFVKR
ncbi:MAG: M23 family metallopeptidase [Piscirickettsiaceae bacterium]|jgi:murein DD-endopeptidase MepM/ murein hydrolase activator NlpD|nr:M23 family metallopeptidase [Piscirickettsiaceae bacterium]